MSAVVFLGIKHCGKSTQGRLLAQKLEWPLFDSDELLQGKYASMYEAGPDGATARAIMKKHGEEFFREFEAGVIRDFLLNKSTENCVLSLGGGVADNVFLSTEELKKLGTLVYLKIDPEIAYKRIEDGGIPPFLAGSDPHGKFLQICQKRMPRCEELADVIAEVPANGDAEALSAAILTELEKRRVFEK